MMARTRLQQAALWTASALLLLGAAGTAGYVVLRQRYLGAGMAAGGSEARGETWRQAQNDPHAREEYEEMRRLDRQWATEQARVDRRLLLRAGGLAVAGIAIGLGAWRRRRTRAS